MDTTNPERVTHHPDHWDELASRGTCVFSLWAGFLCKNTQGPQIRCPFLPMALRLKAVGRGVGGLIGGSGI